MRHSNQSGVIRRLPILAAGLFALTLAGCGSVAPASGAPSAAPTPLITPDPHLREPVTADQIFRAFGIARLGISANTASLGKGAKDPVIKLINASLGSWPVRIIEYRSSAALQAALKWKAGDPPGGDESPYAWAGLNILVEFGPISARAPSAPDTTRQAAAASMVAILDPLLWPMAQRAVVPLPSRTAAPAATPVPSAKPPAKPSPKATPKPTKKP